MKTLCLFSLLLFGIINCLAQSPQAISYQAVARNNVGNLISNQNISIRFSVRNLTASGTILYRETHSVITNSLGLFNLNIGQGTVVIGTFALIDWSVGSKFMQVEMDATGGITYTDMGTQQLLSVPYALNAGNVQWNKTGNNILNLNSGNVGIGATAPVQKLEVDGLVGAPATSGFGANGIVRFIPAGSNAAMDFGVQSPSAYGWIQTRDKTNYATNLMLSLNPNGGNVGIGTTSPLISLQIGPSTSGDFGLQKGDVTPNAGYLRFGDNTGWKFHIGRFRESSGGLVNNNTTGAIMTMEDNGNVGIGTVSPGEKLDVQGRLLLDNGFSSDNGAIVYNNNSDYLYLGPRSGTSSDGGAIALFGGSNNVSGNPNGIDFNTDASSPAVRILGNGFLGIGTTTPEFKLTVEGGILAKGIFGGAPTLTTAGAGTRMIWYPKKGAFRAGTVNGTQWDDINIGTLSIAMGSSPTASAPGAVAIGTSIYASGTNAVAMGYFTTAIGEYSTALGSNTEASGDFSTALGKLTTANGENSTAMGLSSTASGIASTALGGFSTASGTGSLACGDGSIASGNNSNALGYLVTASGLNSTALGTWVSTNNKSGSFIYGDGSSLGFTATSTANNQFMVRAAGGTIFYSNSNPSNYSGVSLAAGGGSWTSLSDRKKKENFKSINTEEILQKISEFPVTIWNYKSQPATQLHIGCMSQDFYAAFHLDGESDTTINSLDIDGINMAAIQALKARTDELKIAVSDISRLSAELGELKNEMENIKMLIGANKFFRADVE